MPPIVAFLYRGFGTERNCGCMKSASAREYNARAPPSTGAGKSTPPSGAHAGNLLSDGTYLVRSATQRVLTEILNRAANKLFQYVSGRRTEARPPRETLHQLSKIWCDRWRVLLFAGQSGDRKNLFDRKNASAETDKPGFIATPGPKGRRQLVNDSAKRPSCMPSSAILGP